MAKRNIKDVAIDAKTLGGISSVNYFKVIRLSPQDLDADSLVNLKFQERSNPHYFTVEGDMNSIGWPDFEFKNFPFNRPGGGFFFIYLPEGRYAKEITGVYGSDNIFIRRIYYNNGQDTLSPWRVFNASDILETLNNNGMNISNLQMGGGITDFLIGDYAVTVRQKGGSPDGKEKYQRGESSVFTLSYEFRRESGLFRCESTGWCVSVAMDKRSGVMYGTSRHIHDELCGDTFYSKRFAYTNTNPRESECRNIHEEISGTMGVGRLDSLYSGVTQSRKEVVA